MPLIIVAVGVAMLLLLMIRYKLNGFISLILVALAVGIMQGMPIDKVVGSIKAGVGGTLGSLALIMGFGAMLGKLLADCGGAQRIATTLIEKFGQKHIQWAVVLTGFTVGFALFYEVGLCCYCHWYSALRPLPASPCYMWVFPWRRRFLSLMVFCHLTQARPPLPPFSTPIWAKRCCTARCWQSQP